jgi:small redox-active disulfide protein 2
MKHIKVLGSGCKNCQLTAKNIQARAQALGIEIALEKVEDFAEIARYGVMATPGVVVDEVVVHSGGVPSPDDVEGWLR